MNDDSTRRGHMPKIYMASCRANIISREVIWTASTTSTVNNESPFLHHVLLKRKEGYVAMLFITT